MVCREAMDTFSGSNAAGARGSGRGLLASLVKTSWLAVTRAMVALVTSLTIGQALSATVNGLTINENLPATSKGVTYSQTISVTGGTPPYTFAIQGANTLPPTLTLSAGGTVSGVVSCLSPNGSFRQIITITDSAGPPVVATFTGNDRLSMNVTAGPGSCPASLTLAPATLPNLESRNTL